MTDEMIEQKELEENAVKIGLDPLMERSFVRLLAEVPKRLLTMIMKLFSLKGVGFGVATWLLVRGSIEPWAWLVAALVLIFGEKALGFLKDLR